MKPLLTHQEARAFYDCFGKKQDLQRFYEDPAIDVLLARGEFASAHHLVELGLRHRPSRRAAALGCASRGRHVRRLRRERDDGALERGPARPVVGARARAADRRLAEAASRGRLLRPVPVDLRPRPPVGGGHRRRAGRGAARARARRSPMPRGPDDGRDRDRTPGVRDLDTGSPVASVARGGLSSTAD